MAESEESGTGPKTKDFASNGKLEVKEEGSLLIEDIYDMMGGMGVYQWCAFVLIGVFSVFGVESIAMNFVGGLQEHWCHVEELSNLSHNDQKYIAIPMDSNGEYEECEMFDLKYDEYSWEDFKNWNRSDYELTPRKQCGHGWTYDQSEFVHTVTSKVRHSYHSLIHRAPQEYFGLHVVLLVA